MDTDWTFSSCFWLWEEDIEFKNACSGSHWTRKEDKAFENALALCYNDADQWDKIALAVPGKTIEDLKLHYEALRDDVVAIESGKVPLPRYSSDVSTRKKKKEKKKKVKSVRIGVQRGVPWTEEEHKRFLYGLQRYGRGDWKSISRYCVLTKSNSQVASHAQKYFKRLDSATKAGKRPSINDITIVPLESISTPEKPTTINVPIYQKQASTAVCPYPNDTSTTIAAYPKEASSSVMQQMLPPTPFGPFSSPMLTQAGTSAAGASACGMFGPPIASEPIQEPSHLVGLPTYLLPDPLMQETGEPAAGSFDLPSTSEIMNLDMFMLANFLDI
ncbi:Zuotin [Handroanthus impetiginosus]|uniref:Zuotin n=1 Tax=Handroanthus impetiginosus TaxID=429701 RepID=A0A2G9H9E6_9LAMI|nr:Zuotin [Handroanthus impetiginosus]